MNLKTYKPLLGLLVLAALAYVLHKLAFYFLKINTQTFYYSIETLYLMFLGLSILVFIVLLKVKEKSFDNVGMSFLLNFVGLKWNGSTPRQWPTVIPSSDIYIGDVRINMVSILLFLIGFPLLLAHN